MTIKHRTALAVAASIPPGKQRSSDIYELSKSPGLVTEIFSRAKRQLERANDTKIRSILVVSFLVLPFVLSYLIWQTHRTVIVSEKNHSESEYDVANLQTGFQRALIQASPGGSLLEAGRRRRKRRRNHAKAHSTARATPYRVREILSQNIDFHHRVKVHRFDKSSSGNLTATSHSNNTVVSAYFDLNAKHSKLQYLNWMQNFLSITDNMVIFTQSDMVDRIMEMRKHAPTIIVEMKMNDLPIRWVGTDYNTSIDSNHNSSHMNNASHVFWQNQLDIDREGSIHRDYRVFWIWLSKSWWVTQAINANWFHSDIFMWSDIGCFRDRSYNRQHVLQHPEVIPHGTVLWMAHRTPDPPPRSPIFANKMLLRKHFYHSGSQAAGQSAAWLEFHYRFSETMDNFLMSGTFIGDDQCVSQATCLFYPNLCAYVPFDQVKDSNYFGLRYALRKGGTYQLWHPPPPTKTVSPQAHFINETSKDE